MVVLKRIRLSIFAFLLLLTINLGSAASAFAATGSDLKIFPATVTVILRDQQQFTAALNGQGTTAVRWAVNGIVGGNRVLGTISRDGIYIAPAEIPAFPILVSALKADEGNANASSLLSLVVDPDLPAAHDRWVQGVTDAAARFGCTNVAVQQQPDETVTDALKLFAMTASDKNCLALYPVSTDPDTTRYSFAWGGKVDGIDVYYISDVGRMRIWNASPVTTN